jgi:DNA-binding response OmpR family regulator
MESESADYRPPLEHPWRLLICDDSPIERLALAHFLRNNDFSIDEAADGESAVQLLQLRPVDLLILDLQMPGKDGFHVLSYLQKHRPGLPVILLSGMPIEEIQDRVHLLPSRELPPLLIKPVDPSQLLELIDLELAGELPHIPRPQPGQTRNGT